MLKAISSLDSISKSKNASFSSLKNSTRTMDLPCSKKLNGLQKDSFTKRGGLVCGLDLSFEDA